MMTGMKESCIYALLVQPNIFLRTDISKTRRHLLFSSFSVHVSALYGTIDQPGCGITTLLFRCLCRWSSRFFPNSGLFPVRPTWYYERFRILASLLGSAADFAILCLRKAPYLLTYSSWRNFNYFFLVPSWRTCSHCENKRQCSLPLYSLMLHDVRLHTG